MSLISFHDTIAAIATAEGRGALAIVRISGADAIAIVSKVVSEPETLWVARGGTSIYTRINSCTDFNSPSSDRRRGLVGGGVGLSINLQNTTPEPHPLAEEGELIDD